jgi:hypothetical protein
MPITDCRSMFVHLCAGEYSGRNPILLVVRRGAERTQKSSLRLTEELAFLALELAKW